MAKLKTKSALSEPDVYKDYLSVSKFGCDWLESPVGSYRTLWESINGDGAWDLNSLVWCVSFRRVEAIHAD